MRTTPSDGTLVLHGCCKGRTGRTVHKFRSLPISGQFDDARCCMVSHRKVNVPVKPPISAPKLALAV